MGDNRSCTNKATLGERGEFPLQLHGIVALLSFWHRVAQMPNDTLVKQAYNFSINSETSQSEWLATVKFLTRYLGVENHFQKPTEINPNHFVTLCKTNLKAKIAEQWCAYISNTGTKVNKSSKLRYYKTFKELFCKESYLDLVSDFQLRKVITKFRCSDHPLEIEKGRHKKLKIEERICKVCISETETEMHFLQRCPLYANIRNIFFGSDPNWTDILKCKDQKSAYNLAIFLIKAFKLREDVLASL